MRVNDLSFIIVGTAMLVIRPFKKVVPNIMGNARESSFKFYRTVDLGSRVQSRSLIGKCKRVNNLTINHTWAPKLMYEG